VSSVPTLETMSGMFGAGGARLDDVISMSLLGPFRVRSPGGLDLTPKSKKSRAILAYLGRNNGRPVPRQRLARMLWDRVDDQQARASLRQSLHEIARCFQSAPSAVVIDRESIALDRDAVRLLNIEDAGNERTILDGEGHAGPLLDHILEGFDGLSIPFDDWVTVERGRIAAEIQNVLDRSVEALKQKRLPPRDRALAAGRILAIDPCHEAASRLLMRALLEQGDIVGLSREYERCKRALALRFDAAPSPRTQALFQARVTNKC
jgi:DNA-binding SARP family transcriptional activator